MRRLAYIAILIAALAAPAWTAVYDLVTDWSDTQNPFGPWSLMKSPTQLFTIVQPDYMQNGTNQRTWADQSYPLNAHVPAWAKTSATTIWAHGAEFDRTGTNQTSVVWTSPETGIATISGAVWNNWLSNRLMTWQLRKNGAVLTQGTLRGNGTHTITNPFYFGDGLGGQPALTQIVRAGDKLQLVLISNTDGGNIGDGIDLKLRIETSPRPIVGASCASASSPMMQAARDRFLFTFWGRATYVDWDRFTVDDGSGSPVQVVIPNFYDVFDGDLVSALGFLDPTTTPPTLISTQEALTKQSPP